MNEALCSILCQEDGRWCFDIEQTYIAFQKDNTGIVCISCIMSLDNCWLLGKLCAGGGFCWSILSEFEWKSTAIEPLDYSQTPQGHQSPHLLGQLNIEITLTKRLPPFVRKHHEKNTMVNGGSLTDDAFQPKSFTVRIEQGSFITPARLKNEFAHIGPHENLTWTKRLVFNTSPYPPESEWKETWKENWKEPDGCNYWDCKEFVAHSPEVKRFAAMHTAFGIWKVSVSSWSLVIVALLQKYICLPCLSYTVQINRQLQWTSLLSK